MTAAPSSTRWSAAQDVERFVDLDTHQLVDRTSTRNGGAGYYVDRFALAASGNAFVHTHETGFVDVPNEVFLLEESWSELVALPTGAVQRRFTNTTQNSISKELISANGLKAWIYQASYGWSEPYCPESAMVSDCVVASRAVLLWRDGQLAFDLGEGALGSIDISSDGRFLLVDKEHIAFYGGVMPKGPVQIVDAVASAETLSGSETYVETHNALKCRLFGVFDPPCTVPSLSVGAQVSDDLRVVVTTTDTGKGWYEYTAAP